MKKYLFSLFLGTAVALGGYAQDAKAILDKTVATLKSAGGIQAHFETTHYVGNQPSGTAEGEIWLEGSRFKVRTAGFTSWFDGKTQWTLLAGGNEVNVSTPTEAERQSFNPYSFVGLYKSGYQSIARSITYKGVACQEVQLTTTDKAKDVQEIRLVVDKQYFPLSIRMKQKKGDWVRIRVSNIRTKQAYKEDFFRFNEKEYPNVEVIDLR